MDNYCNYCCEELIEEGTLEKQRKPDIALAKEKLDWEPKMKLEKGLIKTIDYFLSPDTGSTPPTASISGGNQTVTTTPITLNWSVTAGTNPITSISWVNSAGGSGSLSGTSGTFSPALQSGSNVIALTASDGTLTGSSSVTITYNLVASTINFYGNFLRQESPSCVSDLSPPTLQIHLRSLYRGQN